jgi:hypothetical protein
LKEFRIFPTDIIGFPMKQYEAVIEVMQINGGYATLGELYKKVFKIENVKWGTKTPLASIRRIVQDERFFFKIKPGLWALKTQKEKVLKLFEINKGKTDEIDVFNHSYYQGLLLEIGNFKNLKTFVPAQDKNKKFLEKPLGTIATITNFYQFSYKEIINRAKSIDVSWFNERKFPHSFFEIEHSTDFKNSLLKFVELQDFNTEFRIVADKQKEKQFNSIMAMSAFKPIQHRVRFLSYDLLAELHVKTIELMLVENTLSN